MPERMPGPSPLIGTDSSPPLPVSVFSARPVPEKTGAAFDNMRK